MERNGLMTEASTYPRYLSAAFLMLLVGCSGCVALNLPSDRFHDPSDGGGVFGDWRTKRLDPIGGFANGPVGNLSECHCGANCHRGAGCLGGDELSLDPFDTSQGKYAVHEEPEIPWPRYHPVPTRPIFGRHSP